MAQQSVASVARTLALLRELRDAASGLSVHELALVTLADRVVSMARLGRPSIAHATASRLQDPARLLDDLLRGVATLARALGG